MSFVPSLEALEERCSCAAIKVGFPRIVQYRLPNVPLLPAQSSNRGKLFQDFVVPKFTGRPPLKPLGDIHIIWNESLEKFKPFLFIKDNTNLAKKLS